MKRIYLYSLVLLLVCCKKIDHYAQLVDNQPYIITGEIGLYSIGLGNYPGYNTTYLVGDTALFVGKFFLDRPGSRIQVGSDTAHVLSHVLLPNGTNPYTHQTDQLDVVKFLITQGMGLGNTIPVSIAANGVTIQAPTISIRQFQGIRRQTDTTLYVDSITNWKPADLAYYRKNYIPLINQSSISGNGIICFNNVTGIYALNNGAVTQWLAAGSQLQDPKGAFTIKLILGSAISFAGDSLTFSAQVSENIPDTTTNFIYRLCKMDLASRTVTTINRTEVNKTPAAVNESPVLYEGAINTLHLVAAQLKTDVNGSLYFLNLYPPANTSYTPGGIWYTYMGTGRTGNLTSDVHVLNNICRINSNGVVKSLFANRNPYHTPLYTVPGSVAAQTSDYLVSLDGTTGYACDGEGFFGPISLGYFDLQQDALLISTGTSPSGYRFFSYDTSKVTGLHVTNFPPYTGFNFNYWLNDFLILPDGDLLSQGTASLMATNLQNKTSYCYAGTEAGLGAPPAVQNKTTGPAKYVLFWSNNTFFAGMDKLDNIYYYSGFQDYVNGLSFYKLYSKK